VFSEIAKSRTVDHIFPTLRDLTLQVLSPPEDSSLEYLLAPTITTLRFHVHCDYEADFVPPLLAEFARLTTLKELGLYGCIDWVSGFAAALELLPHLQRLENVKFDTPLIAVPKLSAALGLLPNIKNVELNLSEERGPYRPWFDHLLKVEPDRLSVPSKLELSRFQSPFARSVMCDYVTPRNLQTLILDRVLPSDSSQSVEQQLNTILFTDIADACPQLRCLRVALHFRDPVIDFATIKPVMSLPLQTFDLAHFTHLDFTNTDIASIAQSLGPTIEHLSLNHYPRSELRQAQQEDKIRSPYMDLSVLASIAEHCPKLQMLAMSLDTSVKIVPSANTPKFPLTLEDVFLGKSPMGNPEDVFNHLKAMSRLDAKGERAFNLIALGSFADLRTWNQVSAALKALGKLEVGKMDVEVEWGRILESRFSWTINAESDSVMP
jgi:hypothetical protein